MDKLMMILLSALRAYLPQGQGGRRKKECCSFTVAAFLNE